MRSPTFGKVARRAATSFPMDDAPGPFLISDGFLYDDDRLPGDKEFWVLSCMSEYPTPLNKAWMKRGWLALSDHSGTIYPALDAMSRGAQVIEVHIKLNEKGPDAESSITPYNLRQICEARDAFAEMRNA